MSMSPETALFQKYKIGKLLGCGAFAKVYLARDVATGQDVAIKVIHKSRLNNDANLIANIKREISIMAKLRHPHTVKLYEVLATRNIIYIVLEYVKGGELFAKVAKGRFGEGLSRKYFQQLISVVSYCHARGIYHRDLKPENLLLDENEDLKVSDFGLSALTDQVKADGLLHTLCGTPAYVAPEILAKRGYDGAKIDVWSCGVILFVLTAGYLPFNDPNLMNMYKKIYRGEFRCPKWMSPGLKRLLNRLLDTNPKTRITIAEIRRDPWFRKGYKDIKIQEDLEFFLNEDEKSKYKPVDLNAFDIISFSSGLDLSALFHDKCKSVDDVERLMVEKSPEKLMETVVAVAKAEEGRVKLRRRKDWGVELEGQNGSLVEVDVYRLTDRFAVVEVRRKGTRANVYSDLWNDKIRPLILAQPDLPVAGGWIDVV